MIYVLDINNVNIYNNIYRVESPEIYIHINNKLIRLNINNKNMIYIYTFYINTINIYRVESPEIYIYINMIKHLWTFDHETLFNWL